MKILISGYVLAEGRFSMVRTARSLYQGLRNVLEHGDEAALDGPFNKSTAPVPNYRSLSVKFRKRVWLPLRLYLKSYDVLHIVDSDYLVGLGPSRIRRTVVTCHDMMPLVLHGRLDEAFPKRTGRWFYRRVLHNMPRCGCVVADSAFTRDCILRFTDCDEARVRVIHMGVDEVFRPEPIETAGVRGFTERYGLEGKRVVLSVGTTTPYKNFNMVVEVIHRLVQGGERNLVLLKVGGVFSRGLEEYIGSLGLAGRIVHVRGLTEEELVWAYNCADLLLFPSLYEGFGLPVIEAMACGTPVVCSNGGALPETAGEAAAMRSPEDAEGLTEACRRVLNSVEYAADLRERGLKHAKPFTWARTASAYYDVYREVYNARCGTTASG